MRDSYIFFDKETAFEGEVSTDRLVLEGVITGDVRAVKDVLLKQGSIVQGKISTKKYTVEEGSVHQGKIRMDLNQNGRSGKNSRNETKKEVDVSTKVVPKESVMYDPPSAPFDSICEIKETYSSLDLSNGDSNNSSNRLW